MSVEHGETLVVPSAWCGDFKRTRASLVRASRPSFAFFREQCSTTKETHVQTAKLGVFRRWGDIGRIMLASRGRIAYRT